MVFLKELIPAGADSETYEDFKKDYDKCVESWSQTKVLMDQMKQELIDAILGGFTPGTVQSKDPVNLGTGNFIYEKEDMQFAGSPELTLARFYNALDGEGGQLGTGWRHSFETALIIKEDKVQLYLPDGKKFTYSKKKDRTYFSDKTRDRLVKVDGKYVIKKADGDFYEFDETGNCLCYVEESGNCVTYTVEDGLLRKVNRDSDGAFYEFHYDEDGKLKNVTDSRGRCVSYEYGEDASLKRASRLAGGFYEYQYDETGYISKVSSADGTATVENFFDSQGRCFHQNFPDGGSMSFDYDDENACITLTVVRQTIVSTFMHFIFYRIQYLRTVLVTLAHPVYSYYLG